MEAGGLSFCDGAARQSCSGAKTNAVKSTPCNERILAVL